MACAVLIQCVMQIHHDSQTSLTPNPDERRGDFLSVATFLKPKFHIGVSPRSGELCVQVELKSVEPRARTARASARH